jgi:hypothetical protein
MKAFSKSNVGSPRSVTFLLSATDRELIVDVPMYIKCCISSNVNMFLWLNSLFNLKTIVLRLKGFYVIALSYFTYGEWLCMGGNGTMIWFHERIFITWMHEMGSTAIFSLY